MSSVPGKAPAVKLPPQVAGAHELLVEELGRLLTVEETLARLVLPQLVLELQDSGLRSAVEEHLAETRGHAGRMKEAFLALAELPSGRPAYGLDGLRTEHQTAAQQVGPRVRPILHCAAAMGIEHYEINAYEAAIRLSDALGAEDVGGLLRANLRQEVGALEKLGHQAEPLVGAAL
jgi:ferritin-like metal-binding protein YciE